MEIAILILTVALLTAGVTRLRPGWPVVVGSVYTSVLTVIWAILMLFAAVPCGLSGRGFLRATDACPVQTTHVVSALILASSVPALFIGSVAGFVYAVDQRPSTRRVFRLALLVAAGLMLIWLVADAALPRVHPSD